ncbi:MAG: YcxB family protein [Novosphingobium sp.]|nr:YcxB family protein [Novosphingobium sp.]
MQDEISVTLDEEDFVEAYRPALRSRRRGGLLLVLALIVAVLIVLLVIRFPEARWAFLHSPLIIALTGAVVLAALLVLLLLIAAPALRRRAAQSTLDDHPGMRDPIDYTIDPENFAVRSTYTQAQYPWSQLWDWREGERVIVVMPTPRNFYVLPKRGVDLAVLERLRSYLHQARKHRS